MEIKQHPCALCSKGWYRPASLASFRCKSDGKALGTHPGTCRDLGSKQGGSPVCASIAMDIGTAFIREYGVRPEHAHSKGQRVSSVVKVIPEKQVNTENLTEST